MDGYRVAPEKRFPDRLTHSIQGIQLQEVVMIIYKATCLINKKVYIGKTIYNLSTRKRRHRSDSLNTRRTNCYFHNAIRKYGWNNFKWGKVDTAKNIKELYILEQSYIAHYREIGEVYNLTDGGGGLSGFHHTQEAKRKMSEGNKNPSKETRRKMSEAAKGNHKFLGKNHTAESKQKISEARKGKKHPLYGKQHTEETRQKMREAHKNISIETRQKMVESQKNVGLKGKG